ncbi:hypothetical protein ES702_05759 [subsurface metagenome]
MRLSASCVDTLRAHVNACVFHQKPYHWRSQLTTLATKAKAFSNPRAIATVKRDDRKLRDWRLITKQYRRGKVDVAGRQFKSSITHPTWFAVKWLVLIKILPPEMLRIWREICDRAQKKGPKDLRDIPDPNGRFSGVAADANGWTCRFPPLPDLG